MKCTNGMCARPGLWFRRKKYGWGWTPSTWQGWAVLAAYLVLLIGVFRTVDGRSHSGSDTLYGISIPFVVLTAMLIAICYARGEKPK